jgi:hypothetical protein
MGAHLFCGAVLPPTTEGVTVPLPGAAQDALARSAAATAAANSSGYADFWVNGFLITPWVLGTSAAV